MNCICGRSKQHCPNCGRGDIYSVKRLTLATLVGTIKGYRCRKCGAEFRDGEQCTAPLLTATTKYVPGSLTESDPVSSIIGKVVPSEGALKIIEKIKRDRGIL